MASASTATSAEAAGAVLAFEEALLALGVDVRKARELAILFCSQQQRNPADDPVTPTFTAHHPQERSPLRNSQRRDYA